MDGIYKNIKEYNPNKKRRTLVLFDDMIDGMLSNKMLSNPIVTEKLLDHAKKSAADPVKTASKKAIQKTAEAKGG